MRGFENELNLIKNKRLKMWVTSMVMIMPEVFFKKGASSTGKYHPKLAQGFGGLVRHTKATIGVAVDLFRMKMFGFSQKEKDVIISALILHDGWKYNGRSKYTLKDHPQRMVEYLWDKKNNKFYKDDIKDMVNEILDCINSHMGIWTMKGFERPETDLERFVHLCDYISSRKWIDSDILKVILKKGK